jgi:pyruvate, water dikinase
VDPVRTFCREDEKAFWFLDFHWQRGQTPMGLTFNEDGYNWSTQLAAEQMPLPPGRGLTCRLGGTHTYGSAIGVDDPWEISQRARRLEHTLPGFLRDFGPIWDRMRQVPAGVRHQDHGDRPGAVAAGPRGPRGPPRAGVRGA